ncbi:hypothetical protein SUGI_0991750 [Cryptomeria japonica]|nr:hypothetical protein SUGI_0991750 [Cryptomeria japonica]
MNCWVKYFVERKSPNMSNSDEAMAYGVVVQAATLNKDGVHLVVEDVAPLSLGISFKNGVMGVVVPRNTQIPT